MIFWKVTIAASVSIITERCQLPYCTCATLNGDDKEVRCAKKKKESAPVKLFILRFFFHMDVLSLHSVFLANTVKLHRCAELYPHLRSLTVYYSLQEGFSTLYLSHIRKLKWDVPLLSNLHYQIPETWLFKTSSSSSECRLMRNLIWCVTIKHKDTKQERLICLLAAVTESTRERTLTRSLNTLIEAKAHRWAICLASQQCTSESGLVNN